MITGFTDLFCTTFAQHLVAKVAQLVEHNLAKVRVAGSSPVFRSLPKGLGIVYNIGAFIFNSIFILSLRFLPDKAPADGISHSTIMNMYNTLEAIR